MTFRVNEDTFVTSSKSETDWTKKHCVGVACDDSCVKLADSVTQHTVLDFSRGEFAAFLAGVDQL